MWVCKSHVVLGQNENRRSNALLLSIGMIKFVSTFVQFFEHLKLYWSVSTFVSFIFWLCLKKLLFMFWWQILEDCTFLVEWESFVVKRTIYRFIFITIYIILIIIRFFFFSFNLKNDISIWIISITKTWSLK